MDPFIILQFYAILFSVVVLGTAWTMKKIFPDSAQTIRSQCNWFMFLGGIYYVQGSIDALKSVVPTPIIITTNSEP